MEQIEQTHKDMTLDNKKVNTPLFDLIVQVVILVVTILLLVVDRGLGLMKYQIPDLWYGVLIGFIMLGRNGIQTIVLQFFKFKSR